jgi:hypothetical protein
MNKRGQFFGLYLVLITLFMCFLVIGIYILQNEEVSNSMVSPNAVLNLQDEKELFEMQERNLILASGVYNLGLEEIDKWGEEDFLKNVEASFTDSLLFPKNEWMLNFLFKDLTINGVLVEAEAFNEMVEKRNFLEGIYSFEFSGEKMKVGRRDLAKDFRLEVEDSEKNKINFVVDVEYIYNKDYLFSLEDFEV